MQRDVALHARREAVVDIARRLVEQVIGRDGTDAVAQAVEVRIEAGGPFESRQLAARTDQRMPVRGP